MINELPGLIVTYMIEGHFMVTEKKKIPVADDEEMIRRILESLLTRESYSVIPARNGQEALQLYADTDPDLIVLDSNMPILNGFEVLDRIRKTSEIPVIMLTGSGFPLTISRTIDRGADENFTKPFLPNELIARVNAKVRRYSRNPVVS